MGLIVCLSVVCCFLVLAPVVESQDFNQLPFWLRPKSPPNPKMDTLPPATDTKFYQKFKNIPPKSVTADKLIENFFHVPLDNTAKRRIFLQDNVVVLDSSGSIGKCEYKKGKRALKFLMDTYSKRGENYDYYWAGVEYSTKATIKFKFQPAIKAANLLDSTFKYEEGWTNTADGLAKAKDIFDDFSAGGRRGADQVVFLVTDGNSNRQVGETIPNAKLLKDDHVKIFVVAIGEFKTGIDEMVRISSIAHEDHVLRVATFGDFLDVVKLAIKKVAPDTYKVVGKIPPPC